MLGLEPDGTDPHLPDEIGRVELELGKVVA
jgi:hypothetical protein